MAYRAISQMGKKDSGKTVTDKITNVAKGEATVLKVSRKSRPLIRIAKRDHTANTRYFCTVQLSRSEVGHLCTLPKRGINYSDQTRWEGGKRKTYE
jgi:hypothetical protein